MKNSETMSKIFVIFLVFMSLLSNAQKVKKPTIPETKKETVKPKPVIQKKENPKKQESKPNISAIKSNKPNRNLEGEKIEAEERAERERLAEVERQKQSEAERIKNEKDKKNKEIYDKHLKWSKNMINTNGINSCKSDSDCREMVIKRLKLALTYYDGEEAKNYLKQLQ